MSQLMRHIAACNNAVLPGGRVPFRIGTAQVGWMMPALRDDLVKFPDIEIRDGAAVLHPAATGSFPCIVRILAGQGKFRWRGEAFDVRASADGPVLAQIDRGALPSFGIQADGVHLNGLVRRADGLHLWVAKRSASKALDPGKLDHIVAGGCPAGLTPWQTLIKEAGEEAAIGATLAARAVPVAVIGYAMEGPDGLRRDRLHCYDLELPEDFTPAAADGEVESFSPWPIARVLAAVRDGDGFKFNVNLVLIDLFLRLGLVAGTEAQALRAAL